MPRNEKVDLLFFFASSNLISMSMFANYMIQVEMFKIKSPNKINSTITKEEDKRNRTLSGIIQFLKQTEFY